MGSALRNSNFFTALRALLLTVALALAMFPVNVWAEGEKVSGVDEKALAEDAGKRTITLSGPLNRFDYEWEMCWMAFIS